MEEMAVFKAYLRNLLRQLLLLRHAIKSNNLQTAEVIIDEIIKDTEDSIAD